MKKLFLKLSCLLGIHHKKFSLEGEQGAKTYYIRCRRCGHGEHVPKYVIAGLESFDGWIAGREPDL